jgi:putative GTP pyrophosphokinase
MVPQADPIMEEFRKRIPLYEGYLTRLQQLIVGMLATNEIHVHSVTGRVKATESLEGKLVRNADKYQVLDDVTDLVALRVITYFIQDVDSVASAVERDFSIDRENSVDKRIMDPDRFGYQSLHYVASLSPAQLENRSLIKYGELKFELQIRTILQHAWAEIEHDLGYKSSVEVPRSIRRQFSMLAGVLEMTDAGFMDIRRTLEQHATQTAESVRKQAKGIDIDRESVAALVRTSPLIRESDSHIADRLGVAVQATSDVYMATLARNLRAAGLSHIDEVSDRLAREQRSVEELAVRWIGRKMRDIPAGLTLFFLAYLVLANSGDEATIRHFFIDSRIGAGPKRARSVEDLVQRLMREGRATS